MTHLKRPWCWERLKAEEGDNRGWDGWMASLTQWTWVWVNSGSWWWTGRPDMLQSMGLQRVGHKWATELNWSCLLARVCPEVRQRVGAGVQQSCRYTCAPIWVIVPAAPPSRHVSICPFTMGPLSPPLSSLKQNYSVEVQGPNGYVYFLHHKLDEISECEKKIELKWFFKRGHWQNFY